ncbi:hypothetical protein PRK78_004633 [Emydomyces testavorans]|uniref:Uncharacterized protein n=1 Tax=Emydomyces testavorans TaxID=2070801 RepID=A0AAF0DJ07_9EURO|nr:hypothetical protein PRK78_004633 [Emydomyces testavorans]
MSGLDWQNYPVGLASYSPALDDGQLCQRELKSKATSWRSEKYPATSRVLVYDHDHGVGALRFILKSLLAVAARCFDFISSQLSAEFPKACLFNINGDEDTWKKHSCNDETLSQLLAGKQPQIRFILLESTPHERVLNSIQNNSVATEVLKANGLLDEKTGATVSHMELSDTNEVADELNISLDSLLKVLTRYDIPPAACSHIRGQEQIFGSRISRHDRNQVACYDFWYAIRARAYVRVVDKEADLKMTIVTHYDVKSQATVILLKYRSFNDLPRPLKIDLKDKLLDFIVNPSTATLATNPFSLHLLHFNSAIQYYRRAARDPRDSVRKEEIKAHGGEADLSEIDLRRLHLTLTSLDQDKVQLNFILGVISSLRVQHDRFYRLVKGVRDPDQHDWLYTRVEEEYARFENQITYFKTSIEDVATRAQRLLDLLFNLSTRHSTHSSARMAEESMKESASMSTIAIVTMIFLPGTFVAVRDEATSLLIPTFAANGFLGTNLVGGPNAPDNKPRGTRILVSSQWWIFPAVTIPLTLLTLLIWYSWKLYVERMVRRRIMMDKMKHGEV